MVPVGTIMAYAGQEAALAGNNQWKICNGDTLPKKDYPELYGILVNLWGDFEGPGNEFFKLPDLRSMFLRGVNEDRSDEFADPDKDNRKSSAGQPNKVGSFQLDAYQKHSHGIVGFPNSGSNSSRQTGWGPDEARNLPNRTTEEGQSQETRPKNAYVHWIIKVT